MEAFSFSTSVREGVPTDQGGIQLRNDTNTYSYKLRGIHTKLAQFHNLAVIILTKGLVTVEFCCGIASHLILDSSKTLSDFETKLREGLLIFFLLCFILYYLNT